MSPTVTIITTARRFDHQNHSSAQSKYEIRLERVRSKKSFDLSFIVALKYQFTSTNEVGEVICNRSCLCAAEYFRLISSTQ